MAYVRTPVAPTRAAPPGACARDRLTRFLVWAVALLAGTGLPGPAAAHPIHRPIALEGTVVTPETVIPNGTVLVRGERIEAVGSTIAVPHDGIRVPTGGLIYPGLIDLHNHLVWNVFPPWVPPQLYNNRYEWRSTAAYRSTYGRWNWALRGLDCERNLYGEVKALVGGVTSIQGGLWSLRKEPCIKGLVRNLDHYSGLQGPRRPGEEKLEEVPNLNLLNPNRAAALRTKLATRAITSLLFHLAEGRRGDRASQAEFTRLVGLGLLTEATAIIHGTALTDADWEVVGRKKAKLIWSPRSNLALYGQTTDIEAARKHQVLIAMAPDWSITGSPNMLEELRVAQRWATGGDDEAWRSLVLMATLNPATIAALEDRIGQIKAGHVADVLVIKGDPARPYRALVEAKVEDVQLVLIGGQPYYGAPALMRTLGQESDSEELDVCGTRKSLHLRQPEGTGNPLNITWRELQGRLARAMSALDPPTKLAPLVDCR